MNNTIRLLEKSYEEINDNIKFSEAKNAALITLNSALIALESSYFFDNKISFYYRVLISIFILLMIIPLIISIFSFRATTGLESRFLNFIYRSLEGFNKLDIKPAKYMYYAYINKFFKKNPKAYLSKIDISIPEDIEENSLQYQLASQIVDLSGVAYRKFILFNIAIKMQMLFLALGIVFAVILLIVKFIAHA